MSIHPSLRSGKGAAKSRRNVMKKHERIAQLIAKDGWSQGCSVFGLPKVKQVKMKVRRAEKEKEKEETAAKKPADAPAKESAA